MRIEIYNIQANDSALGRFADRHGIIMEVHERGTGDYFAHFKYATVEDRPRRMLLGIVGNGNTEDAAIADYARKIAGKMIRFWDKSILVPRSVK